jgi:hypothetical protein
VTGYTSRCKEACAPNPGHGDYDAGVTGLSVLAFLGAGFTHLSKDTHDGVCFGDVVRRGLQWMMSHQDPEGCIGSRNAQKHMYNHAVCALAISEAYGQTGSNLFKDQAQKAIDFTVAAQNPGKGWRYGARCGDNDTSATGWAVMALRSAELNELTVPRAAFDGARAWFDQATGADGRAGYTHAGTGKVYVPGLNEGFDHHETMTAIARFARRMAGHPRSATASLLTDPPRWDGNAIDFYYWYCGTLAAHAEDGPKGPRWTAWSDRLVKALVPTQNDAKSGCRAGSWEPVDRWSGEAGRVYATAMNTLALEIHFRHAGVFTGER